MNTSGNYQVRRLENFDDTYQRLVKRYYKKNQQALEELNRLLESIFGFLGTQPKPPPPNGRLEPWPKKSHQPGWEFRKLLFDLPGLDGDAQQGRIMYLVHDESRVIQLFWIYNHDQYPGRPADDQIKKVIKNALRGP